MDVERGRYRAPKQEAMVELKAAEWNPELICIEDKNEGIALYQNLITRTRLPLKSVTPQKDKE